MTSIISEMYKESQKKDEYTIFYMGVNAGAFLGILLCGYLGEKIGWSYGFGLAGIFMLFGLIQFWLAQNIFGHIGLKPKKDNKIETKEADTDKRVPFTRWQLGIIVISVVLGILWILNDPASKISEGNFNIFNFQLFGFEGNNVIIIIALILFLILLVYRLTQYSRSTREKLIAVSFFAFLTIFFWAIFEQSPGTLNIFARDYTDRILEGSGATIFKIVNALITIVPLAVISWVLWLLSKKTFKQYQWSNIVLSLSFIIIWGIAIWMISNNFEESSYNVTYSNVNGTTEEVKIVSTKKYAVNDKVKIIDALNISIYDPTNKLNKKNRIEDGYIFNDKDQKLGEGLNATVTNYSKTLKKGAFGTEIENMTVTILNKKGEPVIKTFKVSKKEKEKFAVNSNLILKIEHKVDYDKNQASSSQATISAINDAIEIQASWFAILNSLFIIIFAPFFSKWWESKYNPSANMKFGLGMFLLALGMACVAFGASGIEPGAKTASVSFIWLVLVYLFHTLGELCVSPVGLSYVSKLVPARMIALMFGIWYLAVAIGMKGAGKFGENIDAIADEKGISYFFWILTTLSLAVGLISINFSASN